MKFFLGNFFLVLITSIFLSSFSFAFEREIFLCKQKKDFTASTSAVENGNDYLSIVLKCYDCDNFYKVIEILEADGWVYGQNIQARQIGSVWVDSTKQVDIMIYGVEYNQPYYLDSLVENLNRKIFASGEIRIIESDFRVSSLVLSKKITDFSLYGEHYVPETVDGYKYLQLKIFVDDLKENYHFNKRRDKEVKREIRIAMDNVVKKLTEQNPRIKGLQKWNRGRRGKHVSVIQLYFDGNMIKVNINTRDGRVRDFEYQEDCRYLLHYLAKDIREAGHTGISEGIYQ